MAATWADFEADDSELAAAIGRRFEANCHHVIATIRSDGAPRVSGTEVQFEDGQVVVGMMGGSLKHSDARRDPRVELHCAPIDTELADGDAKLAGELLEMGPIGEPPGTVFPLRITRASLVRVVGKDLVLRTWGPGAGSREIRRS